MTVDDAEAAVYRALFRLGARRGAFPLMPELGSRLYSLTRVKPAARVSAARQYIAEAISDEPVEIGEISVTEDGGGGLKISLGLSAGDVKAQEELWIY